MRTRNVTKLVAAGVIAAFATAACGGGSTSNASDSGATSTAGSGSTSADSIKGSRFIMMLQSTANANKVVEVHAINLLKEQGVDASVKWNASAPNVAVTQLMHGDIDAYSEAVTGGVGSVAAGIDIKDFALAQPRQDYVFLAKPGINSLADLKGKNLGVQDTTGVNYAQALLVVQKAGLTPKDVNIIAVGGQSARLPALVAGRVDATMLSHSAEIQLAPKGFKTLFDYTKEASNLYDDNVFATSSWLSKNKALAVAFNKALLDSFVWFNDPANADAVVSEAMQVQPAADKAAITQLFDQLRAAGAYPNGTILDASLLDEQQQLYKSAGALQDTVPVEKWVDDTYAKQAKG
ncbi:MAG: ABC transporter substrate-binding protein [Motilibacteraceae bacterium]